MSLATPTVTGYSSFWGAAPNTYAPTFSRDSTTARISRLMRNQSFKVNRAVMRALNGVAPGETVTVTEARIQAGTNMSQHIGNRTIETVTLINRATTSADQAAINAQVYDYDFSTFTYATDASGNGGGGKLNR